MKTPLTQLIERLEAMQSAAPHIERNVYTKAIREAKEMLPIEKEQINMAWNRCFREFNGHFSTYDYFDNAYPQPNKTDSADAD